jgi:hypothetical protein
MDFHPPPDLLPAIPTIPSQYILRSIDSGLEIYFTSKQNCSSCRRSRIEWIPTISTVIQILFNALGHGRS